MVIVLGSFSPEAVDLVSATTAMSLSRMERRASSPSMKQVIEVCIDDVYDVCVENQRQVAQAAGLRAGTWRSLGVRKLLASMGALHALSPMAIWGLL